VGRIVPVPVTEAPGNYNTAALFNAQVRDLNNFVLSVPVFYGYATTVQSIPGGNAMTALNLDTEVLDADGGWRSGAGGRPTMAYREGTRP
jgi:hypothetical protein